MMKRFFLGLLSAALLAPVASAKTLSQLSADLVMARTAVQILQQEDAAMQQESERESSSELFPAIAGAKPVLTVAQSNLLKRCDREKKESRRCSVLKCRLLGESCKR